MHEQANLPETTVNAMPLLPAPLTTDRVTVTTRVDTKSPTARPKPEPVLCPTCAGTGQTRTCTGGGVTWTPDGHSTHHQWWTTGRCHACRGIGWVLLDPSVAKHHERPDVPALPGPFIFPFLAPVQPTWVPHQAAPIRADAHARTEESAAGDGPGDGA